MGPTAEAWLHRTSLVSISRLGTDSAPAPSDRTRLRLVWKALVPGASFRTRINPVYTDLDVPATAPLNNRSLVVCGAAWSCRGGRSCMPEPEPKYTAFTWLLPPRPTRRASVRRRA